MENLRELMATFEYEVGLHNRVASSFKLDEQKNGWREDALFAIGSFSPQFK